MTPCLIAASVAPRIHKIMKNDIMKEEKIYYEMVVYYTNRQESHWKV